MELLIVSGLSGAGKSVAMNALEDIGYFCIDNIPAALLPSITAFSKAGDNQLDRVALCMDVRGCRTREEIEQALQQLDEQKKPYKILFLDAPDEVLMRRYSETRRRHPISISEGLSTREAFLKERQILEPLRVRANYTINTALLSTAQNKERSCDLFLKMAVQKAPCGLPSCPSGSSLVCRRRQIWYWMYAACRIPSMCRSSNTRPAWIRKWWTSS